MTTDSISKVLRGLRFTFVALAWLGFVRIGLAQSFQDRFADRQTFVNAAGVLTGSNADASVEPGEPRHGGKVGGHSLWISWVAPDNGIARFKTETSGFDTLISAYYFRSTNDSTFDKLVEAARNDDSEELGDRESRIEFGARAGQRFEIAVDGYFGAVGDIKLQWDLNVTRDPPPEVLTTPPDATLEIGAATTLTVTLSNVQGGTKFKWYFNGNEIPEAKETTLAIPSMQTTNVGRYKLLIDAGQNVSFFTVPSELQINTEGAPALAQSKFPDAPETALVGSSGLALVVPGSRPTEPVAAHPRTRGPGGLGVVRGYNGSQIFNTTYATTDPAEPAHCGVPPGSSYWLAYQPPVDGTVSLDTIGSSYDTVIEVYTYNVPPTRYQDLISVGCDHGGAGTGSRVRLSVLKTRQYVVAIGGVGGARGTARLNYSLTPGPPPQPPTLLSTPQAQVVTNGADVQLAPAIQASPPLRCLWRKDGQFLTNSGLPSLLLRNVSPIDSGVYTLAVSNDWGGLLIAMPLGVFMPTQLAVHSSPDGVSLSFPSVVGQKYTIEATDTLLGPWLPYSAVLAGNGQPLQTNFVGEGIKFFRLKLE